MDYSRFLTEHAKSREPSVLRELVAIYQKATIKPVFLAGGMPSADLFPFKECVIKLDDDCELKLDQKLMRTALQYGPTEGYTPFVKQLKSLTSRYHKPSLTWDVIDLAITNGAQDGLSKVIMDFFHKGDYIIIEDPSYIGFILTLTPYKPNFLRVKSDSQGMCPDSLASVLKRWNPEEIKSKKSGVPKLMYLNTTASNPSGASLSIERKHQIYEIAQKYNLLILEDDPYYFLRFDKTEDFSPSFLSLDTDGRVIRFDSISKILSPGMRLGYVTAHKELIKIIRYQIQTSNQHASSLSQVICSELMSLWNEEEFDKHVDKLRAHYKWRRDMMLAAMEKYLKGLCEWSVPDGGMFFWLKVLGVGDTWKFAMGRAMQNNVLVAPGKAFMLDKAIPCPYLRLSYSQASPENIDSGIKLLSEAIKEEIRPKTSILDH